MIRKKNGLLCDGWELRDKEDGDDMGKWIKRIAGVLFLTAILSGCSPERENESVSAADVGYETGNQQKMAENLGQTSADQGENQVQKVTETAWEETEPEEFAINSSGATLSERIPAPEAYQRIEAGEGSFLDYIRSYPLKPDGSPELLYDGREKGNQTAHAAVFDMPVFDSDLQQCADSVIRMYGEYFWAKGDHEKIAFHLTNGFLMDYPSWREGNRLEVDGNRVSWVKSASYDDSYETFLRYLQYVMMYAGTLSLDEECTPIDISQIQAGDMFIKGGSPGHCVMVADVAVNGDGEACFLLAQGYMPAQEFHVLKNPLHENDPWYYVKELSYPFETPEYVFQEGSLKRWYLGDEW